MLKKIKSEKGYIDGELIFNIIIILITVVMFGFGIYKFIFARTVGNKTAVDLSYTYKKAIVYMNNEKLELNVKTWTDYEGEQIQIITEDDKVYLVSSFNTILINE